jgi:hypothetical protein
MRLIAMGVPATGQNKGKANHHPQKRHFPRQAGQAQTI